MNDKIILLVEDNPDDVALARRALQKNKVTCEVRVATDGVAAMQYLRAAVNGEKGAVLPAVILLDLKLPLLDGLGVLRQIRAHEQLKRLPVVMLTSSKEPNDLLQSYNLGANSFFRKPVDFDQFTEAIRQIGLYWLQFNVAPP